MYITLPLSTQEKAKIEGIEAVPVKACINGQQIECLLATVNERELEVCKELAIRNGMPSVLVVKLEEDFTVVSSFSLVALGIHQGMEVHDIDTDVYTLTNSEYQPFTDFVSIQDNSYYYGV